MAVLPFGMWDVGEAFNEAVDMENEEEDQYEEEVEEKRIRFKIKTADLDTLSSDLLVIAVGTTATTFVELFLELPGESIGEIICLNTIEGVKENVKDVKASKLLKERCLLYKINNTIICQLKSCVKPEDAHLWIKQLLSYTQAKQVAVLSSQPKSSFQGDLDEKNSDNDLLRHLKTTSFKGNLSSCILEEGNIISGVPAAVLSHCEVFNVPAVLYVNFRESHFVDVFSLKAYEEVLKDDILKVLPKVSKTIVSQKLKNFDGIGIADNNLYI